ncbi:hypothetical protein HAX54_005481 [Datura stramonium]|uniref:Uncharacterized protein n=1 Tax=Datura stramonium TaxID=4076 RepID=A0ABS8TA19_DATST|nr:hypothetical protein [Datura stramonium]
MEEEQHGEEEVLGSSLTMEKVAAAKQFIENHYKTQMKSIQERKERASGEDMQPDIWPVDGFHDRMFLRILANTWPFLQLVPCAPPMMGHTHPMYGLHVPNSGYFCAFFA